MGKQQIQSLRGMYDLVPEEAAKYDHLLAAFRSVAESAGYGRMETPLLEDKALYLSVAWGLIRTPFRKRCTRSWTARSMV
jgi:histidyl-tRNA synthetase